MFRACCNNHNEALIDAIKDGNLDQVQHIAQHHPKSVVQAYDEHNRCPLMVAIGEGNVEIIDFLADHLEGQWTPQADIQEQHIYDYIKDFYSENKNSEGLKRWLKRRAESGHYNRKKFFEVLAYVDTVEAIKLIRRHNNMLDQNDTFDELLKSSIKAKNMDLVVFIRAMRPARSVTNQGLLDTAAATPGMVKFLKSTPHRRASLVRGSSRNTSGANNSYSEAIYCQKDINEPDFGELTFLQMSLIHQSKRLLDWLSIQPVDFNVGYRFSEEVEIYLYEGEANIAFTQTARRIVMQKPWSVLRFVDTGAPEQKDHDVEVVSEAQNDTLLTLRDKIGQAIHHEFDEAAMRKLNSDSTLDLSLTINELVKITREASTIEELQEQLKVFFKDRQEAIRFTALDYFEGDSMANKICHAVASIVFPEVDSWQTLLEAVMNREHEDKAKRHWLHPDYISHELFPEDGDDESHYFRDEQGGIQYIEKIVEVAIAQLKAGRTLLKDIWLHTNPLVDHEVPLSERELAVLAQRSPTLKELIDFTQERQREALAGDNILEKFNALARGLKRSDVEHSGSEFAAGRIGYFTVDEFLDWWHSLPDRKQQSIRAVSHELGQKIDRIKRDHNYCTHIMNTGLYRILRDEGVQQRLNELSEVQLSPLPANIDKMDDTISDQLKSPPLRTTYQRPWLDMSWHAKSLTDGLNSGELSYRNIAIKRGCDHFWDEVARLPKYQAGNKILQRVQGEEDNELLAEIHKRLLHSDYYFLRKHGCFSRFFGDFNGQRRKTSRTWAMVEKAVAVQMMRNIVRESAEQSQEQLNENAQELMRKHSFVGNCRKHRLHAMSSHTSRLFRSGHTSAADKLRGKAGRIRLAQ